MTPSHPLQDSSARPGKRTARACDECRRLKIRCELPDNDSIIMISSEDLRRCRGCSASGIDCTFTAPVHKRGPPKGLVSDLNRRDIFAHHETTTATFSYLNALEQRLNDAEALLGALICSKDPRAASLIVDLSKDPLASSIIGRVSKSEFGPTGRAERLRASAGRQFKQSETPIFSIDHNGHLVFTSPSNTWQDYLDMRLTLENKLRSNNHHSLQPSGMQHASPTTMLPKSSLTDSPGMSEASLKDLHSRLCEEINSWLNSEDSNGYHGVNVLEQQQQQQQHGGGGLNQEYIRTPTSSSSQTDYTTDGRPFTDLGGTEHHQQQQQQQQYHALCDILGLDGKQWEA